MKHLRKSILTLLALTLFGGAGAWAQGPTAAELTIPANWNLDNTPITAADLSGFVAVDSATADQWVDASTNGYAKLIYAFTTDGQAKYIRFQPGFKLWGTNTYYREAAYEDYYHEFQVFYTTGGGAIELTKEGANQWTLGQTPDYDLELQVEYYEAHALKDIPAGWTVKVNDIDKTAAIDGDSLMITETDSVTLIPAGNPRRVKSVTLEEDVPPLQTVHVGGNVNATFYYLPGETWQQAIENHPTENTGFGITSGDVRYDGIIIFIGYYGDDIHPDTVVDPNADYQALLL